MTTCKATARNIKKYQTMKSPTAVLAQYTVARSSLAEHSGEAGACARTHLENAERASAKCVKNHMILISLTNIFFPGVKYTHMNLSRVKFLGCPSLCKFFFRIFLTIFYFSLMKFFMLQVVILNFCTV